MSYPHPKPKRKPTSEVALKFIALFNELGKNEEGKEQIKRLLAPYESYALVLEAVSEMIEKLTGVRLNPSTKDRVAVRDHISNNLYINKSRQKVQSLPADSQYIDQCICKIYKLDPELALNLKVEEEEQAHSSQFHLNTTFPENIPSCSNSIPGEFSYNLKENSGEIPKLEGNSQLQQRQNFLQTELNYKRLGKESSIEAFDRSFLKKPKLDRNFNSSREEARSIGIQNFPPYPSLNQVSHSRDFCFEQSQSTSLPQILSESMIQPSKKPVIILQGHRATEDLKSKLEKPLASKVLKRKPQKKRSETGSLFVKKLQDILSKKGGEDRINNDFARCKKVPKLVEKLALEFNMELTKNDIESLSIYIRTEPRIFNPLKKKDLSNSQASLLQFFKDNLPQSYPYFHGEHREDLSFKGQKLSLKSPLSTEGLFGKTSSIEQTLDANPSSNENVKKIL